MGVHDSTRTHAIRCVFKPPIYAASSWTANEPKKKWKFSWWNPQTFHWTARKGAPQPLVINERYKIHWSLAAHIQV
jgi:hypothetical protein